MTRSSLFVAAQEELRSYIRDNGLKPGDRLPSEADLATLCDVSRGAIREATRSLQTLGVIEARHGNGLYVSEFSFRPIIDQLPYGLAQGKSEFLDVLQAREALETGLMFATTAAAAPEDLAECERLVHEMEERESAGEATDDIDRRFHLTLYRGLDNSLVNNLIEVFWDLYRRLDDRMPLPHEAARRAAGHMAIVEALRAGDADAAMQRMREHFHGVHARVSSSAAQSA